MYCGEFSYKETMVTFWRKILVAICTLMCLYKNIFLQFKISLCSLISHTGDFSCPWFWSSRSATKHYFLINIIGRSRGLGKTTSKLAFIGGLHSGLYSVEQLTSNPIVWFFLTNIHWVQSADDFKRFCDFLEMNLF